MSPRYTNKTQEALKSDVRQKLIDAAVQQFVLDGFEKANINTISQAAGFGKGTVYNYFSSKEALMISVLQECGREHCSLMIEAVRSENDTRRRLMAFFSSGFAYVVEHPRRAQLVLHTLYGANPVFRQSLWEIYQPLFLLMQEEILQPGIDRGELHAMDARKTGTLIMTFYLGAASSVDEQGQPYMSAEEVYTFVLRSLQA